jgi:hypothetical protein
VLCARIGRLSLNAARRVGLWTSVAKVATAHYCADLPLWI